MSEEKALRESWAAFVKSANAAQAAGYIVTLPQTLGQGLGISATSKVAPAEPPKLKAEPAAEKADPVAEADKAEASPILRGFTKKKDA